MKNCYQHILAFLSIIALCATSSFAQKTDDPGTSLNATTIYSFWQAANPELTYESGGETKSGVQGGCAVPRTDSHVWKGGGDRGYSESKGGTYTNSKGVSVVSSKSFQVKKSDGFGFKTGSDYYGYLIVYWRGLTNRTFGVMKAAAFSATHDLVYSWEGDGDKSTTIAARSCILDPGETYWITSHKDEENGGYLQGFELYVFKDAALSYNDSKSHTINSFTTPENYKLSYVFPKGSFTATVNDGSGTVTLDLTSANFTYSTTENDYLSVDPDDGTISVLQSYTGSKTVTATLPAGLYPTTTAGGMAYYPGGSIDFEISVVGELFEAWGYYNNGISPTTYNALDLYIYKGQGGNAVHTKLPLAYAKKSEGNYGSVSYNVTAVNYYGENPTPYDVSLANVWHDDIKKNVTEITLPVNFTNALFKVTITYSADGFLTQTNSYYLLCLNPEALYWSVCPDAKLVVGSEDTFTIGETTYDTEGIYDAIGRYHLSAAYPFRFALFLSQETNTQYDIYYTVSNVNTLDDQVLTTNSNAAGNVGSITNSEVWCNGKYREEIAISKTNNDWGQRYLLVEVKSTQSQAVVWRAFFEFIFQKAPVISELTDGDTSTITITERDPESISIIYYTYDATEPTWVFAKNVSGNYIDASDNEIDFNSAGTIPNCKIDGYTGLLYNDSSKPTTQVNTMYYATEFVGLGESVYTGERDNNNKLTARTNFLPVQSTPLNVSFVNPEVKYVTNSASDYDWENGEWKARQRDDDNVLSSLITLTGKGGSTSLSLMLGTNDVPVWWKPSTSGVYMFASGGVKWNTGQKARDTGFDEFIDIYTGNAFGDNSDTNSSGVAYGYSGNGNPYTELDQIGSKNTEDGGMFLQPVSGDFFRLEPEHDGVVTLWVRQNGSSQNDSRTTGNIVRRPVYVMDEDGVIMRRSTVKPTVDSYYGVNGTYAVISERSKFRDDFEESWNYGLYHWASVDNRFRGNYRLISHWYNNITLSETGTGAESTVDIDHTTHVGRFEKIMAPIYRSEWLYQKESEWDINIDEFARYGYELPNFNYVRYRIPVKAGKTYYVGGRGTKNGFVAINFEPMEANYNYLDYITSENLTISEQSLTETDSKTTSPTPKYTRNVANIIHSYRHSTVEFGTPDAYVAQLPQLVIDGGGTTYISTPDGAKTMAELDEMITRTVLEEAAGEYAARTHVSYPTINCYLKRDFTPGNWYPIVLPFSVSETKLAQIFGQGTMVLYLDPNDYAANGKDRSTDITTVINPAIQNSRLCFTRHYYQMLYANTPAFICPTGTGVMLNDGKIVNPFFEAVTYQGSTIKNYTIGGGYSVYGTYVAKEITSTGSLYYLTNDGGSAHINHLTSGKTVNMRGTRVWIDATNRVAPYPSPQRLTTVGFQSFTGDDECYDNAESGIDDVVVDAYSIEQYDDDNVYDLMGRIVGKDSLSGLKPGIYIFHGQKQYVR